MAYSFPLSTAQLMAILPVHQISFDPQEAMELSETGGGEILTADLGTRLWQGEIVLGDMTRDEADECLPMLDLLRQPGASFMVHDLRRPHPKSDPTGAITENADIQLYAVRANNRDIRLSGLPSGFQLRRHDYVGFGYGARIALHRVASQATTAATGITPWFEVVPNIRPGWSAGAAVTLSHAGCKAIYMPGSFQPGRSRATMIVGASFRFIQSLR